MLLNIMGRSKEASRGIEWIAECQGRERGGWGSPRTFPLLCGQPGSCCRGVGSQGPLPARRGRSARAAVLGTQGPEPWEPDGSISQPEEKLIQVSGSGRSRALSGLLHGLHRPREFQNALFLCAGLQLITEAKLLLGVNQTSKKCHRSIRSGIHMGQREGFRGF